MIKLSEKQIQRQILQWLELKQIFHWRNNVGAVKFTDKEPLPRKGMFLQDQEKTRFVRFVQVGSPDIFVVLPPAPDRLSQKYLWGKIIGIEVKSSTGKQRDSQKEWQTRFEQAGGVYILAYSLDDVMGVLE